MKMRGSVLRRLASGLFLVWFAVFGLTRGILGVCPEHTGGHGRVTADVRLAATTALHQAAARAESHGGHVGMSHETAHQAAREQDADAPADHDCDCRGECCCCAAPYSGLAACEVFAVDTSIAMPRHESTTADRPITRVDFAQPLATAPPVTLTA